MSDLKPLSASVGKITSATLGRKFVSLGRILSQWDDIVGPEMAVKAQPLKLSYRKPKNSKEKPEASLDIAVSSADATLLYYQTNLILERINQIFGERWITSLRFVHRPANNPLNNMEYNASPAALSLPEKEALEATLSFVEDPEIRKQLEKLGQGVLRKIRTQSVPEK